MASDLNGELFGSALIAYAAGATAISKASIYRTKSWTAHRTVVLYLYLNLHSRRYFIERLLLCRIVVVGAY